MSVTQDDIDQQSITQLHDVVVELSKNCFELKKLCATVLGASMALIATLTVHRLDTAFFMGAVLVIAFFWIADAQSYYYQEKIRIRMKQLQEGLIQRAGSNVIVDGIGMPVSAARESGGRFKRITHSAFNGSMTFYYGLLIIDSLMFMAYYWGLLHSTS
jgi:hypothetical protein